MGYTVEILSNGLIVIIDRRSKLRGTYNSDCTYRHGDLRLSPEKVQALIGW